MQTDWPEEPFKLWFIRIQIIFIYFLTARGGKKTKQEFAKGHYSMQNQLLKVLIWLVAGSKILVSIRIRPLYYLF